MPATTNNLETRAVPQRLASLLAEVLLIVLVFFIAAGDPTPNVNETHYIARLKHYWNPEWCKGDLFLESADTQIVFIWIFGWLTRWVSLSATAWIGRGVVWALLAWSWQRLSWRVAPRPLAAVLSAALFVTLNNSCQMAGEWVVGGVEAKCFAYAFVLLALREWIDRRWGLVCVLLGAAIAFHPIVGGWSALVGAIFWFKSGRRVQPFVRLVPSIIVGGLLALVGIVPALSLTWHEPSDEVAKAAHIYVFDRLPHHLALLSLPGNEIAERFLRHGVLLLVLAGLSRSTRRDAECRPIVQFAWSAALIACVGLAIELSLSNHPLGAQLLRYYWFRLTDFAAPMAVSVLATRVIAAYLPTNRRWATPIVFAMLLIPGWYRLTTLLPRQDRVTIPPADNKIGDYDDWVKVCDWVAANTPPDALFLTPRLNLSFKWRAGRPEVVNRKDIPQDAHNILVWYDRLKDIYYTNFGGIEQPLDSIGVLGSERVRELAKKYHASYLLMDRGQLLALPIVYRNEEYVVYRIEDRRAGNGR